MTRIVTAFVGMRATNLVTAAVGEELVGVTHRFAVCKQMFIATTVFFFFN